MNELFSSLGIVHQITFAYTPQQNRVAERKHRHLLNVVRSMLFHSGFPLNMWTESILTTAYLINRSTQSSDDCEVNIKTSMGDNTSSEGTSKFDYSLFTKKFDKVFISLLVYVDDIVITGNNLAEIKKFKEGICLSQRKYCLELLHEYGLLAAKHVDIPLPENTTLNHIETDDDHLLDNIRNYRKLVGDMGVKDLLPAVMYYDNSLALKIDRLQVVVLFVPAWMDCHELELTSDILSIVGVVGSVEDGLFVVGGVSCCLELLVGEEDLLTLEGQSCHNLTEVGVVGSVEDGLFVVGGVSCCLELLVGEEDLLTLEVPSLKNSSYRGPKRRSNSYCDGAIVSAKGKSFCSWGTGPDLS
nr:ribonuclease H-like domain-containing protein [Tanacetum cinerariifolium]